MGPFPRHIPLSARTRCSCPPQNIGPASELVMFESRAVLNCGHTRQSPALRDFAKDPIVMPERNIPNVIHHQTLRTIVRIRSIRLDQIRICVDTIGPSDEGTAPGVGGLQLKPVRHLFSNGYLQDCCTCRKPGVPNSTVRRKTQVGTRSTTLATVLVVTPVRAQLGHGAPVPAICPRLIGIVVSCPCNGVAGFRPLDEYHASRRSQLPAPTRAEIRTGC